MTMTEFLLARIAEDEAVALPLLDDERWAVGGLRYDDRFSMVVMSEQSEVPIANTDDEAVHIARHDPARVLADVEAKRRIVKHEVDVRRYPDSPILRALAWVYSDHPDYDEAWRPVGTPYPSG